MLTLMLFFTALVGGILACGVHDGSRACPDADTSGTTPGSYIITVMGTSGTITETGTVKLTVQ
jgi:hypothetical protein